MHDSCPDCRQHREPHAQTLTILYRETTVVVDAVPGSLCPACGSLAFHGDTLADVEAFLRTRRRRRPRLTYSER